MSDHLRIALDVPDKPGRHFTFQLKKDLFNERSVYLAPPRLLALSDIEGNFQSFRRLLIKNRVINRKYQWLFEDGHLVICGDCFDRGDQVTECLWLIYSLEEKARREGGHVHFILGNHEIMNMNGDWRYVHPKYAVTTKNSLPHTALYDGNSELWRWLRTKNIIEKIGNVLFVHGGISPELLQLQVLPAEINRRARSYYTQAGEVYDDPLLYTVFNSDASPFWYRGYYQQAVAESLIDDTLAHFGVKTIVTGHTIVDQLGAYFNGKVINLNTNHAAGISEALLIKKNKFYRIDNWGKRSRLK